MPAQEKTEAPTPRRREELRRKGQVPKSVDFSTAFSFLATFSVVSFLVASLMQQWEGFTSTFWIDAFRLQERGMEWVLSLSKTVFLFYARMVAPVALIAAGIGLFMGFLQTGFVVSFEKLKPQFQYVNPLKGVERLFSLRTFMEFLKVSLKVLLGIVLAYLILKSVLPDLSALSFMELRSALSLVGGVAERLGFSLGALFLGIGFFDFFYQRFEYERNIRMTKEELKEELKKTEGDPLVRSRIRSKQREIARLHMMQEVPKAQVVVTNPTHVACALRYERGTMRAPVLVAKGKNFLAQRIKQIARENKVPIVENKKVAWDLYKSCKIGQEIPGFLYRAVAEILAFVYRLKKNLV